MKSLSLGTILIAFLLPHPGAADAIPGDFEQKLSQALNRFAFNMYREVSVGREDCTISPMSIHLALLMTLEGARGETASEMAKVLGLGSDHASISKAASAMLQRLRRRQRAVELRIVNDMWGQAGHPFKAEYKRGISEAFEARVSAVDFVSDAEGARKTINDAVARITEQRIKDLIPPGALDASTRLVLTNAIWFKAKWATPFKKRRTKPAPFNMADDTKVSVPMMHRRGSAWYFEDQRVQGLKLNYRGGDLEMNILLPKPGQDLAALERDLTPALWNGWISSFAHREVDIFLPRFKTKSGLALARKLEAMGMPRAFSTRHADFSGIDGGAGQLVISEVIHRTWVEVNEAGTEAAAATAIMKRAGAARREKPDPVVFRADRPFLFAIRDGKSGSILFLGRVDDPR